MRTSAGTAGPAPPLEPPSGPQARPSPPMEEDVTPLARPPGIADALFIACFSSYPEAAVLTCDELGIEPADLLLLPLQFFRVKGVSEPIAQVRYNLKERARQTQIRELIEMRQKLLAKGTTFVKQKWLTRQDEEPDAPGIPYDLMVTAADPNQKAASIPTVALTTADTASTHDDRLLVDRGSPSSASARKGSAQSTSSPLQPKVPKPPKAAPICKRRNPSSLKREEQFLSEANQQLTRYVETTKAPPSPPEEPLWNDEPIDWGGANQYTTSSTSAGSASRGGGKLPPVHPSSARRGRPTSTSSRPAGSATLGSRGGSATARPMSTASSARAPVKSTDQRQVEALIRNTMLKIANEAIDDEKSKMLSAEDEQQRAASQLRSQAPSGALVKFNGGGVVAAKPMSYKAVRDRHLIEVRTREFEEKQKNVQLRLEQLERDRKNKHVLPQEAWRMRHVLAKQKRDQVQRIDERKLNKFLDRSDERQRKAATEEKRKMAQARASRLNHEQLSMLRESLKAEVVSMRETNDWAVPRIVKDTFGGADDPDEDP